MKYNQLGRTGVRISALALGTATLGVAPSEKDADAIIGRALDLGINVIDTANSYGNQTRFDRPTAPPASERRSAEEIIGSILGARRKDVVLCSKVMEPVGAGPNDRGLSRRHIFQQVEESLRRLKTDHLDVYYAHHPDATASLEETVRAFDDLVRQGKILYSALSTYSAWQTVEALWKADVMGATPPVAVQTAYNMAARDNERELAPVALKHGLSLTIYGPLAGGLLVGGAAKREFQGHARWGGPGFTPQQLEIAAQLEKLAAEVGKPPAQLALAWLIARPAVGCAIIGPETLAELETNAAAGDLELEPELLAKVDEIGKQEVSMWSRI